MCVLICLFKWLEFPVAYSHCVQAYGFSPVCVRICCFKWLELTCKVVVLASENCNRLVLFSDVTCGSCAVKLSMLMRPTCLLGASRHWLSPEGSSSFIHMPHMLVCDSLINVGSVMFTNVAPVCTFSWSSLTQSACITPRIAALSDYMRMYKQHRQQKLTSSRPSLPVHSA